MRFVSCSTRERVPEHDLIAWMPRIVYDETRSRGADADCRAHSLRGQDAVHRPLRQPLGGRSVFHRRRTHLDDREDRRRVAHAGRSTALSIWPSGQGVYVFHSRSCRSIRHAAEVRGAETSVDVGKALQFRHQRPASVDGFRHCSGGETAKTGRRAIVPQRRSQRRRQNRFAFHRGQEPAENIRRRHGASH